MNNDIRVVLAIIAAVGTIGLLATLSVCWAAINGKPLDVAASSIASSTVTGLLAMLARTGTRETGETGNGRTTSSTTKRVETTSGQES